MLAQPTGGRAAGGACPGTKTSVVKDRQRETATDEIAMIDKDAQRKRWKLAYGVAGFVILIGGTPCVLFAYGNAQAGPADSVGMFGVFGLGGLVLFVGILLLYKAFQTDAPSSGDTGD